MVPDAGLQVTSAMPTHRPSASRIPLVLLLAAALSACGSGSTEPTELTQERSFVGVLSVPGADSLGGVFHLTTVVSTASAAAPSEVGTAFARVLDWVVPPLWAQATSGAVTGTLTTNGGIAVPLSGTYSGSSFNVTGSGYEITANATSTGALSGTGTAPGGATATVQPISVPVTAPPPSNPTGTYKGTFEMFTVLKSRNVDLNGQPKGACQLPLRVAGDLTMHVSAIGGDQVEGHLDVNWREHSSGIGTCPAFFTHNHTDYFGIDFGGTSTMLNPVRSDTYAAGPTNSGTLVRSVGFTGAVSGNTVVGTLFITMNFQTPVSDGTHYESFSPIPTVTVTLQRN